MGEAALAVDSIFAIGIDALMALTLAGGNSQQ